MKRKLGAGFYFFRKSLEPLIEFLGNFDWKFLCAALILIPFLFALTVLMFFFDTAHFLANVVVDRGSGVLPELQGYSDGLPRGDFITEFLPAGIRILLILVGLTTTVALIYAGAIFVIHFDEDSRLQEAKKILYWSIIGIGFIVLAYALVWGVTKISWSRF